MTCAFVVPYSVNLICIYVALRAAFVYSKNGRWCEIWYLN